jgi:Helix-turn-helix domain
LATPATRFTSPTKGSVVLVGLVMMTHAQGETAEVHSSVRQLAREAGLHPDTVVRAVDWLETAEWIARDRRGAGGRLTAWHLLRADQPREPEPRTRGSFSAAEPRDRAKSRGFEGRSRADEPRTLVQGMGKGGSSDQRATPDDPYTRLLRQPTADLDAELAAKLAPLEATHGPPAVHAAADQLAADGRRFEWPSAAVHAVADTLGPVSGDAAAAARNDHRHALEAQMDRNRRRANGVACERCGDTGYQLNDTGDAYPCDCDARPMTNHTGDRPLFLPGTGTIPPPDTDPPPPTSPDSAAGIAAARTALRAGITHRHDHNGPQPDATDVTDVTDPADVDEPAEPADYDDYEPLDDPEP